LLLLCVVLVAAGCGAAAHVRVAPDLPPSPATWKAYPTTLPASCWGRSLGGGVMRNAPTVLPAPTQLAPAQIVTRELARFGDRRYIRNAQVGPLPPITLEHLRGYFAGKRPPANALWLYVSAPRNGDDDVATWEVGLFGGGVRDAFCAAGGAPLAGFTAGRGGRQVFDDDNAVEQHFPNPSPAAFTARVERIGKRYGFTVQSLRLLHPFQTAPLLVVETHRGRKAFVKDVPAIMQLLDPQSVAGTRQALTFEGFFFEARDAKGRFVDVFNVHRGEVMGGQWSADHCSYPYAISLPAGSKPCPS
jgi:hypothetical protein